eukprot:gene26318-17412_t
MNPESHKDPQGACAFMAFESLTVKELPEGVTLPKEASNMTMVSIKKGSCVMLYPIAPSEGAPERVRAVVTQVVDAGFKVPSMVINFVLRILTPFIYTLVVDLMSKTFSDPNSELSKRIAHRPELYESLRQSIQDLFKSRDEASAHHAS